MSRTKKNRSGWRLAPLRPETAPVTEISPAQLAANQANAQLSTGPRTEEGKARSAQNSRTHGLTSRELVIHPDERAYFDQFLADFRSDLQPDGPVEEAIASLIIHAAWNLRRVRQLEGELFAGATAPLNDPELDRKLDRLSRYAQRFERTFHRGLRELRAVQTARSQRANILPAVRATIPRRADTAKAVLAKRTHPAESLDGDLELLLASVNRETDIWRAQIREKAAGAGR